MKAAVHRYVSFVSVNRLTRILVAILMAHFTFLGGDVSCARHGDRHAAVSMATDHHAGRHVAEGSNGLTSSEQPCETPTQPECCRAMTSCSVNAIPSVTDDAARSMRRQVIASELVRAPRSLNTSPDPPPPRA